MQGSRVQAPGSGPRSELGPKRDAWMLGNCDNGDARALRRITKCKEMNGRKTACGGGGGGGGRGGNAQETPANNSYAYRTKRGLW